MGKTNEIISDLSPRELHEFRDHLIKIGYGLVREKGDEEALAVAIGSLLTIMEYINGLIDEEKFKGEDTRH